MRVLVLGGSGMIGHRMFVSLRALGHEVAATIRGDANTAPSLLTRCEGKLFEKVDVRNLDSLQKVFDSFRPNIVLNAVGVVKQLENKVSPEEMIELNALFPHRLATICERYSSRLVLFSTDCVFDGKKGGYKESDVANATDLYGRTKAVGEIQGLEHVLTIRTSTIGRELRPHGGLLEWFISQEKNTISGFSEAIYTGFPTHRLAKILSEYVFNNPELSGIYHISSEPIDKFTLLEIIRDMKKLDITIEKNSSFVMKRDLNSEKFSAQTGYKPLNWSEMVEDLNVDWEYYSELRKR